MRLRIQSTYLAQYIKVPIQYWHIAIGQEVAAFNNEDHELMKQMFRRALGVRENTATFLL